MKSKVEMNKALDDYDKIKQQKDKLRFFMQELYGALAGVKQPGAGRTSPPAASPEEDTQDSDEKPRKPIGKEAYWQRVLSHLSPE